MNRRSRRRVAAALGTTVALVVGGVAVAVNAFAATGCRVDYVVTNQWQGGFGASVTVTNLGDAINGWTLTWSFTAGQTVTQAWNATVTQTGVQVSAVNVGYNAAVATNASVAFGFNGSWNTATNPVPASFALNGTTCTGAAASTAPATPSSGAPSSGAPSGAPSSAAPSASPSTGASPSTTPSGPVVAFPGAVGFGAVASGGRGGTVYHVTNLNDSGAGSFRDAVSQPNRIVVFDVGGYIRLTSTVLVSSNITIAGQTAPGGGVGIMGNEVSFNSAANVIVRNIRFRQGLLDSNNENNSINLLNSDRLIFDHVSIEFGQWNNVDAVGASNITFQYSINANPTGQQFGAHTEEGPYTWYHNLFANAHNRCPLAKANTQYINNVVYNFQAAYTAGDSSGHFLHDTIGNYFIVGPRTTNASNTFYQMNNQSVYGSGNFADKDRDGVLDGAGITPGDGSVALSAPWSPTTASIPATSAATAYATVLAKAGALPRDEVDNLVLADVRSLGTAGDLWSTQTATGLVNSGYGTLAGGTAPADTDRDGMPDAWESAHGLNPASVADATGDFDRTGYTNIEKYVNGLLDGSYR